MQPIVPGAEIEGEKVLYFRLFLISVCGVDMSLDPSETQAERTGGKSMDLAGRIHTLLQCLAACYQANH